MTTNQSKKISNSLEGKAELLEQILAETKITETINLLSEKFHENLKSVILIGSRANGEAHADSDIDLLTVFSENYLHENKKFIKESLNEICGLSRNKKISLWPQGKENLITPEKFSGMNPPDLLEIDGWSKLASYTLLNDIKQNGKTIFGEDIVKDVPSIKTIPIYESYENMILANRQFGKAATEFVLALHEFYDNGDDTALNDVRKNNSLIAKAVMRAANALFLLKKKPAQNFTRIIKSMKDKNVRSFLSKMYDIKTRKSSELVDVNEAAYFIIIADELIKSEIPYVHSTVTTSYGRMCQNKACLQKKIGKIDLSEIDKRRDSWVFYASRTLPEVVKHLAKLSEKDLLPGLLARIYCSDVVNYIQKLHISKLGWIDSRMWDSELTKSESKLMESLKNTCDNPAICGSSGKFCFKNAPLYALEGNFEKAISVLDQILRDGTPLFPEVLTEKGFYQLLSEKYEEAEKTLRQSLTIMESPRTLVCLATALVRRKKYDDAVEICDKTLKLNPESYYAQLNKGVALQELGRLEEAILAYEKAIHINKNDFRAYFNIAHLHYLSKKYSEAIKWYDKSIRIDPTFVESHFYKGEALSELAQHEEAVNSYANCLKIDGKFKPAIYKLIASFAEQDKIGDALKAIENHKSILGKDAEEIFEFVQGVFLNNRGKHDDAIKHLENVLKADPNHPEALIEKGMSFISMGLFQDAINHFCEVIDKGIKVADSYTNMGYAYRRLGLEEMALDCYTKAIEENPELEEAWTNKANSLMRLSRLSEARECYNHATQLNPDSYKAWANKGALYLQLGKYGEALRCCDKAIKINNKYEAAWENKLTALEVLNYSEELAKTCDYIICNLCGTQVASRALEIQTCMLSKC